VATFRDIELLPGSALSTFVDGCAGSAQRIQLHGIAASDAAMLLERLGQAPSQRDADALYALSNGNPLLLTALSERLQSEGRDAFRQLSELDAFALPERLASTVQKHLARLPDATRQVLAAACAFGREFPLPPLAALFGCSEPQLLEWLEPARCRGLIRACMSGGPAESRLAFSHALICNAIYCSLAPTRRIELHRQIAELLERSAAPEQLPLYELAHHYHRAAADGCRSKAIEFSQRAALQAERMMAFEVAAGLYERALELSRFDAPDNERAHVLLCNAGNAWYRAGELASAEACFDRAAELAQNDAHAERFAWAVVLSASAQRGTMLHDQRRQHRLREAFVGLPQGDSEVKALLMAISMVGARSLRSLPERQRVTCEAVAMARRLQDERVLQWTLNAQHLALWGAVPPREMVSIASEIVELSQRTGDKESMLDGMLWRIADCCDCGDVEDVLRLHAEYAREAEQLGSPWHRYMALGSTVYEATRQGEYERAAQTSEEVRKLGLRVCESLAEGFYEVRGLFMRFQRGDWSEQAARIPDSVPSDYRVFWLLASLMRGEREQASRTLQTLLASHLDSQLLDCLRRPTLAVLGQVAVWLAERDAVERLYGLLLPHAGLHLNLQAWVYLGPVDYYLGLMAAALDMHAQAREHLERALSQTALAPTFHAQAQCEYGRALIATGARDRGRTLLANAANAAEQFGMQPLCARAAGALSCP
jgi:tetratricopeptide (TPR) repeat protein